MMLTMVNCMVLERLLQIKIFVPAGMDQSDWNNLAFVWGNQYNAAGPLKSTDLWDSPNTGATNASNYTARPGGMLYAFTTGSFTGMGKFGYWWQMERG